MFKTQLLPLHVDRVRMKALAKAPDGLKHSNLLYKNN